MSTDPKSFLKEEVRMQVARAPIAAASACTSEKITAPIPVGEY
jgi:hypothetical protein